jgi:hypothetical protein
MRDAMIPVSKEPTMNSELKTFKDALALLLRACRLATPFSLASRYG